MRTRSSMYRRRRLTALVALVAVMIVAAAVIRSCAGEPRRLAPAAGDTSERYDPLAYDDGRRGWFEQRAAAGVAHLLYAKSPGGVVASARRTERWRPLIERAVRGTGIDADWVEGIVMLESAGRPDVIAGDDPAAASGLGQILAGTATQLLGMHVDLGASRRLTKRIARAQARGNRRSLERLLARRRLVDDRFDPARAIAGTVRYLVIAKKALGRDDLAVESYHMGIGNLQTVLRRFGAAPKDTPYARVYFESTPLEHASAYRLLSSFGDDSSTYLWRVLAARAILDLYRHEPQELSSLAALHHAGDSSEWVLHPPGSTPAYASVAAIAAARKDGLLVEPPPKPALYGLDFNPPAGPLRALRPAALAALVYIGVGTKEIAAGGRLTVAAATRPGRGMAAGGYQFDVARHYRDRRQALAFQFMLDRLQALNLIAWRRAGDRIQVVAASDAAQVLGSPAKLARDALRR